MSFIRKPPNGLSGANAPGVVTRNDSVTNGGQKASATLSGTVVHAALQPATKAQTKVAWQVLVLREGKIFAMDYAGSMVFKLPRERCAASAADGAAIPFDRGQGKPLREALVVEDADAWLGLTREALAFARG